MDQPTGDAPPPAQPPAQAGPAKSRTPILIAGGVALAALTAFGLWFEGSSEVGKIEKLQIDDSDFGKLKGRTLREIGSFEAELSSMQIDVAEKIRPVLTKASRSATAASSMKELEEARALLDKVREMAGGQGAAPKPRE